MQKCVITAVVSLGVLGWASGASAGGAPAIDSCALSASIGQPPTGIENLLPFSGDGDNLRAYDNFAGITGPITEITWWGGGLAGTECAHEPNTFEVAFYTENGGQPGALLSTREVTPQVVSSGFANAHGTIFRYTAAFSAPVNLASGWMSVFATGFDGCFFYWAPGAGGNGSAYSSGGGQIASDLAFCLSTTGEFASSECLLEADLGQPLLDSSLSPGFSDAGDGLRAYENFSGLAHPVSQLVWWGGGTAGGQPCMRTPDFEVAFYSDNGGQPGALITSQLVTATAAATGLATQFGDLYRFEATLDTPVSLAAGWVSVFAVDFVDCYFYWANSASGNGAAHTTNGSIGVDFALCLYTEDGIHRADYDTDGEINLSELLRVIQLYNSDSFGCEPGTEDGFAPSDSDRNCLPHDADYLPTDWTITLNELLRIVQFFNSGAYHHCPDAEPPTEDGYCPGMA